MIVSEIRDLVQYIVSTAKVNCEFGDPDLDPNQYPFVKVLMTDEFDIFTGNDKLLTNDLPLILKIIVAKGNEFKALEVLERLFQKMNQFKSHEGHELEGTATPEYVEETKTFEISILYKLKLLIQDT